MQERGRISVNVVTLTGEKYNLFLFPFDSIREEISNLGICSDKSKLLIVFYQGKQIQPDLTPAALEMKDGDTISIYFKKINKNIEIFEGIRFPEKPKLRTPEDEQDRLVDISMTTHENSADGNRTFLKIMLERERQKQLEEESRELIQPETVITESTEIQTLPLPVCFNLDSSEFGNEYQLNPRNLSPLNPLRRNCSFPDAPSGR